MNLSTYEILNDLTVLLYILFIILFISRYKKVKNKYKETAKLNLIFAAIYIIAILYFLHYLIVLFRWEFMALFPETLKYGFLEPESEGARTIRYVILLKNILEPYIIYLYLIPATKIFFKLKNKKTLRNKNYDQEAI